MDSLILSILSLDLPLHYILPEQRGGDHRGIDAGEVLDLEYLKLPHDRYDVMRKAYLKCGDEKLKPVFEYLNEKYTYDELKLARVLLRA